ncbi:DUF2332 domain-containing protein [Flavisolibacter tropicus]|uniref:DUF2332 domain-containing protein n=1 Tax=Flavisolibacter tropicus TaxID=1492898 RepID=UPI0008371DE7|nr:DUF2332 domain-containing protein [Flavisolibacter tropicus]
MKTLSTNTAALSKRFERFAEEECKGNSPLYFTLSKQIACDEELLRLCTFVKEGQPVPNAFLAAVHFYVLKNKTAFLAQYYPSVTGQPTEAISFDLFKAFVQEHQQGIVHLLQNRIVQTNVITRCNYLLPIFSNILSLNNKPVTIIDIGASAGLNLNFDQYEYYYNDNMVYGDSHIKLHCQIKEGRMPNIKPCSNSIQKIGIDQHPIDLANAEDLTWLQALVWPDQAERFIQLAEALQTPLLSAIKLIAGSTIADFKKVVEAVDPNETLILYATHVLYQFTPDLLREFYNFLDDMGQHRDFYFLSAEATQAVQLKHGVSNTAVVLTTYKNKQKQETFMAETNGHGNWIKWN